MIATIAPFIPMPEQAQVTHYGEPGSAHELHVFAVRWEARLGHHCRRCPRDVCNFREHPDGSGLCSILVRGRVPAELAEGLGLPSYKGGAR